MINFYGILAPLLYHLRGFFLKIKGLKGALHFILKQSIN
ncbi:hypothetical protein HPHPH28_0830 [Helicobacter pylori Hp H-28]|nr:hypothetical protein HPHPH28_0830 [Helicobacter pylori Hp H-28]